MRIVIVGGGAGGLELATSLGNKFGKKQKAEIVLVDANKTHLWKPLLHEVATGALDTGIDESDYLTHGKQHGFKFQLGRMSGLDKQTKQIELEAILDEEQNELLPKRFCHYDLLVMALGSVTNDFGIKGVAEHSYFLDSTIQAERFHKRLLNEFLRANAQQEQATLNVAIVGAGATGVELSAELHNTVDVLAGYGLENITPKSLNVSIIEAGNSILPALPAKISDSVSRELNKIGVSIRTQTKIVEATKEGFITSEGELIPAKLKVWSAGVKAANFVATLGLETNRNNQLVVNKHLQTEDEHIFAMGDCACLLQEDGKPVPPRAQVAHQQANHMFKLIKAKIANKSTLPEFEFNDKGSLVSLSGYSTVGSLMGNLSKGSMMIEGRIARLVYISLYRLHQIALHGYWRTFLMSISGHINKVIRPKLKLH